MTQDEAWAILILSQGHPHGRMLWAIVEASQEIHGQCHLATWCLAASDDNIPRVWARAVSLLRLPEDVRASAQWN